MNATLERIRIWAKALKRDVLALWIAAGDARTPWYAKAVAGAVAAYALSPIDLVPDFIPVLGYLDDLIIVPFGISLAISLIPGDLMSEYRQLASSRDDRPRSLTAATLIIALWLFALAATGYWASLRFP